MSGIFGIAGAHHDSETRLHLDRMAGGLCHHRHARTSQAVPATSVGLGQINIGIFNSEPQPRRAVDRDVWLTFSGEFYHHERHRQDLVRDGQLAPNAPDSDLALATYLRDGVDGLTQLKGMFVAMLWDGGRRELIVVNDRLGLYPHYYMHQNGRFAIAPEIKALVAVGARRDLNMTAVAEYVRFQQLLGERTWLEGVKLLPHGSVLRYLPDRDELSIDPYWDFDEITVDESIDFDEAVDETIRLFQRAIDARSKPPHKVGVYLSGGRDGRTILGFLDRQWPVPAVTYGAATSRDVVYAKRIAERAGSDHHWFPYGDGGWVEEHAPLHLCLTEGMHSVVHMHGINTLEDARQLFDVSLTGWDGGTVFGGVSIEIDHERDRYYRYPPDRESARQRIYEAFCQATSWPGLTEPESMALGSDTGFDYGAIAFKSLRSELDRDLSQPLERVAALAFLRHHVLRSTINMTVFARSAVEVRSPFMDDDLLTFIYGLPEHVIFTPRFYREIIRRRLPDLGAIPYDHDDLPPVASDRRRQLIKGRAKAGRLLQRATRRPKPGLTWLYADYEEYLRTDLREWVEAILFDPRTIERGLFNQAAVRSLWNRHLSGDELWTIGKIAPLIEIERVIRLLVEDEVNDSPTEEECALSAV